MCVLEETCLQCSALGRGERGNRNRGGEDEYGIVSYDILFVEIGEGVAEWFLGAFARLGTLAYLEVLARLGELRGVGRWLEFEEVLFFLLTEGGDVASKQSLGGCDGVRECGMGGGTACEAYLEKTPF